MEIAHIDLIDEELLGKDRSKAWIHVYISPEDNPNEAISYLRNVSVRNRFPLRSPAFLCAAGFLINNWKKIF